MNLIHIEKQLFELADERAQVIAEYDARMKNLDYLHRKLLTDRNLIVQHNLSLDKIRVAESVVYVHGRFATAGGERHALLSDAIKELAVNRGARLKHEYFGLKNYSGFYGQRSDHRYNCGPRHGYVFFEIGLIATARQRELSDDEIEAVLYYLRNLENIQSCDLDARQK